jgi:hypothetical protein
LPRCFRPEVPSYSIAGRLRFRGMLNTLSGAMSSKARSKNLNSKESRHLFIISRGQHAQKVSIMTLALVVLVEQQSSLFRTFVSRDMS